MVKNAAIKTKKKDVVIKTRSNQKNNRERAKIFPCIKK